MSKLQISNAVLVYEGKMVTIGKPKKKKEPVLGPDGEPVPATPKDVPRSIRNLSNEAMARIEANAAEKKINQGAFISQLVAEHNAAKLARDQTPTAHEIPSPSVSFWRLIIRFFGH